MYKRKSKVQGNIPLASSESVCFKREKRSSLYIMAGTNKQYYAFKNMEEFSTVVALYEECSFSLITKIQMFCFICLKLIFCHNERNSLSNDVLNMLELTPENYKYS